MRDTGQKSSKTRNNNNAGTDDPSKTYDIDQEAQLLLNKEYLQDKSIKKVSLATLNRRKAA